MAKTRKTSSPEVSKPTNEEIAKRAYEIYLERAGSGATGNALDDWTRAERELMEKPRKTRRKLGPKLVAA